MIYSLQPLPPLTFIQGHVGFVVSLVLGVLVTLGLWTSFISAGFVWKDIPLRERVSFYVAAVSISVFGVFSFSKDVTQPENEPFTAHFVSFRTEETPTHKVHAFAELKLDGGQHILVKVPNPSTTVLPETLTVYGNHNQE